jgi:C-terminal processing protease CtpA/Prc
VRVQISRVEREDLIYGRGIRDVGEKTAEKMGEKMGEKIGEKIKERIERKVAKAREDAIFRR